MNQKICPLCFSPFECDGDNDCWCEYAKLTPRAYKQLLFDSSDCICPSCMKKYEQQHHIKSD